eukprot:scaffold1552_cov144-Isochrysis_galbana.AAC.1
MSPLYSCGAFQCPTAIPPQGSPDVRGPPCVFPDSGFATDLPGFAPGPDAWAPDPGLRVPHGPLPSAP